MNWSGHWHGYGPWVGTRNEFNQEYLRRPGASPDDEQTRMFIASAIPPIMTGHALLRRPQAAPERTWTAVQDAVEWLTKNYAERPPFERNDGQLTYVTLDVKIRDAEVHLPIGTDATWTYYARNGAFVSYEVICCPSRFHPQIPCPLPPS